jgi:hypothetical protein
MSTNENSVTHPKFSFTTWIRLHGVDLITMALMGALGLGIYEARMYILYKGNHQLTDLLT